MYSKVSMVDHNWNNWKDDMGGLRSLYKHKYPNYGVFLVKPSEDILTKIRKYFIKYNYDPVNYTLSFNLRFKLVFHVHLDFIVHMYSSWSLIKGYLNILGCYFH